MDYKALCKELEDRLKFYEEDPSSRFYGKLLKGLAHIEEGLDNKTLDIDNDVFANSVLILADKSEKIFKGIAAGRESFLAMRDSETSADKKQKAKIDGQVAV